MFTFLVILAKSKKYYHKIPLPKEQGKRIESKQLNASNQSGCFQN